MLKNKIRKKVLKFLKKYLIYISKFIEPTEYLISKPTTLSIYEYKVNEISNKPFYLKENNQKYSLKEIIQILKKF